mmetsp:Transcript_39865/g.119974  ORF Transcript_39865/g.119974 Transcript_39865/m.119974 type:complete len:273 (-) Transcript_39865:388-1206(-)
MVLLNGVHDAHDLGPLVVRSFGDLVRCRIDDHLLGEHLVVGISLLARLALFHQSQSKGRGRRSVERRGVVDVVPLPIFVLGSLVRVVHVLAIGHGNELGLDLPRPLHDCLVGLRQRPLRLAVRLVPVILVNVGVEGSLVVVAFLLLLPFAVEFFLQRLHLCLAFALVSLRLAEVPSGELGEILQAATLLPQIRRQAVALLAKQFVHHFTQIVGCLLVKTKHLGPLGLIRPRRQNTHHILQRKLPVLLRVESRRRRSDPGGMWQHVDAVRAKP